MSIRKLTPELIEAIRSEPESALIQEVADKYKVSRTTVTRARSGLAQKDAPARTISTTELIRKLLSDGKSRTAKGIGQEIGVKTAIVSSTICSMERAKPPQVERCGFAKGPFSNYPLWRLVSSVPATNPQQEIAETPRRPQIAPYQYANISAMLLGDPPIGRSALDQRGAAQ